MRFVGVMGTGDRMRFCVWLYVFFLFFHKRPLHFFPHFLSGFNASESLTLFPGVFQDLVYLFWAKVEAFQGGMMGAGEGDRFISIGNLMGV